MILFVVQDAGPAKYIAYIVQNLEHEYCIIASNISSKIFDDFSIKYFFDIDETELKKVKLIITGTCLNQGIDKEWLLYAKENNIKSINIIEHWSLYKQRFLLNEKLVYPDYIFVNDAVAREQALCEGIPENKLVEVGNPVLETIIPLQIDTQIINAWEKSNNIIDKNIVLFISEDFKQDFPKGSELYQGFDEYSVVDDILESLNSNQKLIIKLHPSEKKDKYNYLKSDNVMIIDKTDINCLIASSSYIIGMGSFLLIEVALMGRKVYSYRPNQTIDFIGNIISLTNLVDNKLMLKEVLKNNLYENINVNNKFDGSIKKILNFIDGVMK